MDQLLKRPIGAESRGKRSRGHHACVHPKTKFFPKSERERERKNKKRRVPPFSSSLRDMSPKPEPKDAHQLNGTGPAASACSSEGPGGGFRYTAFFIGNADDGWFFVLFHLILSFQKTKAIR